MQTGTVRTGETGKTDRHPDHKREEEARGRGTQGLSWEVKQTSWGKGRTEGAYKHQEMGAKGDIPTRRLVLPVSQAVRLSTANLSCATMSAALAAWQGRRAEP